MIRRFAKKKKKEIEKTMAIRGCLKNINNNNKTILFSFVKKMGKD